MRATRQPTSVLQAAAGRRSLAALLAFAALVAAFSAAPALALTRLNLMSPLADVAIGQDPKTDDSKQQTKPDDKQKKPGIGLAKKKKQNTTVAPKKEASNLDPALTKDRVALPEGYRVPPERLPDLDIEKELPVITKPEYEEGEKKDPEKEKAWRDHRVKMQKYNTLLKKGSFTEEREERELLRYGIKNRLAELTQRKLVVGPTDEERNKIAEAEKKVEPPPTIEKLRDEILRDLHDTSPFDNRGFQIRDAFLDILCEEAPKLLDNNFYVRFSVSIILSNANSREEDRTRGTTEEPPFKATKALLDLVNDPKQHPLYKLHPVLALARICRHKNCKPEDRFAIIEALMKQMTAAKKLPEWYGMRVAESLGQLGDPNDRTRQPVVVELLVSVLKDKADYKDRVRVQAAHSLGRAPLEGYKKADEIAVEILRLANDLAPEYEKDKTDPRWKLYFAWLYMAFHPMNDAEKTEKKGLLAQVDSKPVLAGTKTVVTEAYGLFLPLAQNVLGGRAAAPIPEQVRKIKTWLDARGKANGPGVARAQD